MQARGHLWKRAKKFGIAKKELAEEEHDGYDTHHENLPVGSESWMLRYRADYSQKRLKTNQRQRIKRHENPNGRSRNEISHTDNPLATISPTPESSLQRSPSVGQELSRSPGHLRGSDAVRLDRNAGRECPVGS
jgi:hypothetical protein